jgi:cytochrome b pre-mRNA-processing protein 3
MLLWFRKPPILQKEQAEKLYAAIVAQARQPVFYRDMAVPDTVDGRFDMILLHSFMVMLRLRDDTAETSSGLSQLLYDIMFVDMDQAIREMGVGDLSVGRHIRRMMKAFNGRMAAYENALNDPVAMKDVLRRNVYGTVTDFDPAVLESLANYVQETLATMREMPLEMLVVGGYMPWDSAQRKAA